MYIPSCCVPGPGHRALCHVAMRSCRAPDGLAPDGLAPAPRDAGTQARPGRVPPGSGAPRNTAWCGSPHCARTTGCVTHSRHYCDLEHSVRPRDIFRRSPPTPRGESHREGHTPNAGTWSAASVRTRERGPAPGDRAVVWLILRAGEGAGLVQCTETLRDIATARGA